MTRRYCAFLAMESSEGWSIDADLAIAPLQARNWCVESVAWRSVDVDWDRFDAVYIGTPWDYPDDVDGFLAVLERIDRSRAVLINALSLVRWNISKTYLRDLERRGVPIVPSLWRQGLSAGQLAGFFDRLACERIVIKPAVSTNAADTFLLDRHEAAHAESRLVATFSGRALMIQPFIEAIQTEGEYSLFYFGNSYSHAIRKIPKPQDFRVQEEHGAEILAETPPPSLVACADRILRLIEPEPAYARCDLVRGGDGRFLLMELELIEPSMYLRMDSAAAERFAAEFDRRVPPARERA